jgi:hypothetical protein
MNTGSWPQQVEVEGTLYRVDIIRRPFREGLEARILIGDKVITIAELGLGEYALLEKARAAILKEIGKKPS